jgi:hypothetical protein
MRPKRGTAVRLLDDERPLRPTGASPASGELAKSNRSLWLGLLLSVRGHLFVLSGNLEQFLSHPLSSSFVRQRANAAGSLVALPRCQADAYRFQDTPYCGQSRGDVAALR